MIIAITGSQGAGKGTIVEYLVNNKNFKHFSARDFLIKEIENQNLEVNRDSMNKVANGLREKFGSSYIAESLFKQAEILLKEKQNCIIESIRTVGEINALKKLAFDLPLYIIGIEADLKTRFERIKLRNLDTDKIDFETFVFQNNREEENQDPNKQNIKACLKLADIVFDNNKEKIDLINQINNFLNTK